MRQRAIQRGLRLNEYGLFKSKTETRDPRLLVPCQDEAEIFARLELPICPTRIARRSGEFGSAEKNDLPRPVEWTALKGPSTTIPTGAMGATSWRKLPNTWTARPRLLGHYRHSNLRFRRTASMLNGLRQQIKEIRILQ